jgi:S-phase kinase-associated protein 1
MASSSSSPPSSKRLKITSGKIVKLKSSDNKTFEVEVAVVAQCGTLNKLFEDGYGNDAIPLPNVDGKTREMVLEWCKKHVNEKVSKDELSKFEDEFMEVDQAVLYDLLMAAHYLAILGLLDRGFKRFGDMIEGKQPEEIRQIFNIKNDFSPEEQEELKKYAWKFV